MGSALPQGMKDIRGEVIIERPAHEVWRVIGERFGDIGEWATAIRASRMVDEETRHCDTVVGVVKEQLQVLDHERRTLAYEATEGLPFFMRRAINRWSVESLDANRCKVHMHSSIEFVPILGVVFWPLFSMRLGTDGGGLFEELAHFVETGRPHPRKARRRPSRSPA